VLLPPGVNPVAVNEYIISNIISYLLHHLGAKRVTCCKLHIEDSHTLLVTVKI